MKKQSSRLLIRDWACQKSLLEAGCPSDYLNPKYYLGQQLYPEVEAYLHSYGFTPMGQMFHSGTYKDVADTLFIRNDLIEGEGMLQIGYY